MCILFLIFCVCAFTQSRITLPSHRGSPLTHHLLHALVALKTLIFLALQLPRLGCTVEVGSLSKRNQIRLLCFECRCRLDISTLPKWLEHVQCWCGMRPIPKPENVTTSSTDKPRSVRHAQTTRKKNVQ